jgi:hypothetical protein
MTIKQNGGVFGRNPTFNDVTIEGELTFDGDIDIGSDLKINGDLEVLGLSTFNSGPDNKIADFISTDAGAFLYIQDSNALGYYHGASNGSYVIRDTDNNTRLSIDSSGNISVGAGNLAFVSGKGIDFSATAGTGTSELLDDYEEGVWTPVYVPQIGSFATMTMDISNAKYTKVGRFVYVQASILTDSVDITGGSGGLRLSGFPFASSGFGSFVISYAQAWGGDVPLYGYIENASTYANLRYRTSVNGADSAMLVSDLTNGATANQNYMIISGVYTA